MSIKSGFFNSFNHDRRYNADDFGRIFDGLIRDGIYMGFGDAFRVSPFDSESMKIKVGTGRAWFDHTWMLNESPITLDIEQSEIAMKRIDSVIIEVNKTTEIRANRILVVKGTPSANPTPPIIEHSSDIKRYVLANIKLNENVTKITTSDIENMIGRNNTPYVTGIIQTINIDRLIEQWQSQWSDYKKREEKETDNWQASERAEVDAWETELNRYTTTKQNEVNTWHTHNTEEMAEYMRTKKQELDTWVNGIKDVLNAEAIVKLTGMYNDMVKKVDNLIKDYTNKIEDFKTESNRKMSEYSNEIMSYVRQLETHQDAHISFPEDGSIVKTTPLGTKTTTFEDDGGILSIFKFNFGDTTPLKVKTTFNEDGSIDIRRID